MNISIIIPLFNKEATITRTINSVLAQTHQNFELIIVDDGSTDNSIAHVTPFLTDVRVSLIKQENQGPGKARNYGVANAKFDWVSFIDADDEWHSSFLAESVSALTLHQNLAWFFAKTTQNPKQLGKALTNTASHTFDFNALNSKTFNAKLFKKICDTSSCSMVGKKSLYIALGGFYEKNHCTYGEDSFLITLVMQSTKVIFSNKQLALIHPEPEGLTAKAKITIKIRPLVIDSDYFYRLSLAKNKVLLERYIAYLTLLDAKKLITKGSTSKALKLIKQNLNVYSFWKAEFIKPLFIVSLLFICTPLVNLKKLLSKKLT